MLYNKHIIITLEYVPRVAFLTCILYPSTIHAKVKSVEKLNNIGKTVANMKFANMTDLVTVADPSIRGFYIGNLDYLDINTLLSVEVATYYNDAASIPNFEIAVYKQNGANYSSSSTSYQFIAKSGPRIFANQWWGKKCLFGINADISKSTCPNGLLFLFRNVSNDTSTITEITDSNSCPITTQALWRQDDTVLLDERIDCAIFDSLSNRTKDNEVAYKNFPISRICGYKNFV